jgi:hypothetical protein
LTQKVCREGSKIVESIVRKNELSEETGNYLKPKDCHTPRLSGLPKIHKDGVPMMGIVSMIGSPFEKVSKFLIPILRVIQGRSGLYIKKSRELKEKVKNWRLERNEVLVSYDVKNLYPSIPIKRALRLVERLLRESKKLKDITDLTVGSVIGVIEVGV